MNHAQIKKLASYYDQCIDFEHVEPVNHADDLADSMSSGFDRGLLLEHARWMCCKIQGMDDLHKMNRWIGFIQCLLMWTNIFRLNELRMHTTGIKNDEDR